MEERGVEALERAFKLLECFDREGEPLSLAELSRRSGLYKSTILRIAVSMDRYGYMIRQPEGRYRLGPTLWRLGSQYLAQFDLADLIRPELRALVEATTETASYFVREGNTRVCLYRQNSPRAIRHHLVEGQRLPLEVGAIGKLFRAYCEDIESDPAICEAGYAYSEGERDPEIAAVAVPVLDSKGRIRGALSISGLITRFTKARRVEAIPLLQQSAARLSRAFTTEK